VFAVVTVSWRTGFLVLRKLGKTSFQVAVRRVFLLVCCVLGRLFRGRKGSRKPSIPIYPFFFIPRCVTSGVSSYIRCVDAEGFFQIVKKEREENGVSRFV
jgi:hypothetical protein